MSLCSVVILVKINSKSSKRLFEVAANKSVMYRRMRRNRQLLYMLLVTNTYFLLSNLPYCVSFVLFKGQKSESSVGQLLVHMLLYTNNAINFLFYGLSSQKYREVFGEIFCRGVPENGRSASVLSSKAISNSKHTSDGQVGLSREQRALQSKSKPQQQLHQQRKKSMW
jgi:hypothetical protein